MRKYKLENISSERELQIVLLDLEKRWMKACSIEDSRRRFKEIIRLRCEVKDLLVTSKRLRQSANSFDNNEGFFAKAFRIIAGWSSSIEKKYRDV